MLTMLWPSARIKWETEKSSTLPWNFILYNFWNLASCLAPSSACFHTFDKWHVGYWVSSMNNVDAFSTILSYSNYRTRSLLKNQKHKENGVWKLHIRSSISFYAAPKHFSNCTNATPQHLKSAPHEDIFYVAMLRYVSCFPRCQEGFFNVE